MEDISYNEIPNLQEDWGYDKKNGLPYSGQSVQDFIKKMIGQTINDIGMKYGAVSYESGAIRFYDQEGGSQLGAVTITGTSYSVSVATNTQSSNITVLTSDDVYPIVLTPTTTSMEFGSAEQTPYPEDYTFKIEIDAGNGYIDRTPQINTIKQGSSVSFDIRPYLKVGTNRMRIVVVGASSEQPKTLSYTVTLTALSFSCNHIWNQAWIQGNEYKIINIFFSGNVAKTLNVKVGDVLYTQTYPASASYDTVPTEFILTDKTPAQSGVVPIEMWVSGDGVETKHVTYNIMYVASEDIGNISLICTNNVKKTVYNFTEEQLLEYAVYGISSLDSHVTVSFKDTTIDVLPLTTQNVIAQQAYQLKLSLQVDTVETEGILLEVNLASGDTHVVETMQVDNSNAYLATAGYKFYLNTSLGNNDSADRELVQNTAVVQDASYKTTYTAEWDNFTFADDAWGRDTDGNRALVVKAGSKLQITDLKPFQYSNTKSATFEFMFRASNIADYDNPIITCIDTPEVNSNSVGFIVYPTRVVLLGTSSKQELFQQLPLSEDRLHHISIVIQRRYAASSLNIARIYVDGCENVTFAFAGGNVFYNAGGVNSLTIGQASTDTYLYMMRIYDVALEANQVFANYLNALIETAETSRKGLREDNNITDGTSISYDLCKKAGFNCLVIEINGDKAIPSLTNPVEYSSGCNYHFEYNDHPEWNVSIYDAPMDRQGTTSSLYYWSNLRAKIKNPLRWVYHNLKDSKGRVLEETGKDGYIAGYELNPKVSRITWKKNIASQPQGHKMGATMLYNDIYKRIMFGADSLVSNKILPTTGARVAVYQHPFMGFQKYSDGHYKFIGLYTGGPDKGDKKTFGYNATDEYPSLMMIEGPNHDPYLTRFLIPWTDDVFYDYQNETLSVGAQAAADGSKQEGWDADIVADYSTDKESDAQAIFDLYKSEFKPAYDAIYYNSLYIASLVESGKTLSEINSNVSEFQKGTTRGYANSLMTFYDDEYRLVYYRVKTGKYEVLDKSVHNMLEYLGLSGTPTTDEIITARSNQWLKKVSQYVNMREAYYRQIFDEFIGASDNDAKNSYWRKFLSVADGGKWGFNEDDLDTIFQNDNNGQDTKAYYVEPDDTSSLGADIFQGRTSAFWYALRQHCKEELRGMMREVVEEMCLEAEAKDLSGSTTYQTVYNLIDYYFWRHSSKYFPATAYNQDTQFAYIDVWYQAPNAVYNNVPPLTQIHGDHYETEREWVSKRIPYMFSKYQVAAFYDGKADGYGSLEFTPAEGFTMNVTPAIDLYPRVSYGGSETQNSYRTKAGESCPLVLSASGTTGNYIKGMDWLSDLGDLTDLKLSPRSAADAAISFSVKGKRLRRLKVGDENKDSSEIKFNAATLGVESEALEVIDARNASTIEGSVSLTKCPRIREAYFGGTNLKSVIAPTGGRLTTLQMPESLQDLILHSLNLLNNDGLDIPEEALSNIRNLYINSCDKINPIQLLKRIYDTPDNKLSAIGLIWKGVLVDEDGSAMRMFGKIAEKAGQGGGYSGVDFTNDITPMTMPNVSGALDATGLKGIYQEDIDNILAKLPNLLLSYNPDNLYISFKDAEVLRVLLAKGVGDGTGITESEIGNVTTIGTWFKENTTIEHFDEFEKFTGVTFLGTSDTDSSLGAFNGCTNLKSIKLPPSCTRLRHGAFRNCSSLGNVSGLEYIKTINSYAATGALLSQDINLSSVEGAIGYCAFKGTSIKNIVSLGKCTELRGTSSSSEGVFYNCKELQSVNIPSTLEYIGVGAFYGCDNLTTITGDLSSITTIERYAFGGNTKLSGDFIFQNLKSLSYMSFTRTSIKSFSASKLQSITSTSNNAESAFYNCKELQSVDLPFVVNIGRGSFYGCTSLKEVFMPMAQEISTSAFYGCTSLSNFSFPVQLTSIGSEAFYNCTSLEIEELDLPNLISLGNNAFANVPIKKISDLGKITSLPSGIVNKNTTTSITIPTGVTSISNQWLSNNNVIEEVYGNHLTTIGYSAFYNCTSLKRVDFSSVTQLQSRLFYNCTNLISIPEFERATYVGVECFSKATSIKEFSAPILQTIDHNAFSGCSSLERINIPMVTTINYNAFYGCPNLTGDLVLNEVQTIGNDAFNGANIKSLICEKLSKIIAAAFQNNKSLSIVKLPSITTIDHHVFNGCIKLATIHLGESITSINYNAFSGCVSIKSIVILNETPPSLSSNVFSDTNNTFLIYVPDTAVSAYQTASGWSVYSNRIRPLSEASMSIFPKGNVVSGTKFIAVETGEQQQVSFSVIEGNNYANIDSNGILSFDDGNAGRPVKIRATLVADETVFVETVVYLSDAKPVVDINQMFNGTQRIMTDELLFSDENPAWTLSVNCSPQYQSMSGLATCIACQNITSNPYSGFTYTKHISNNQMLATLTGKSKTEIYQGVDALPLIIRRDGDLLDYSFDGIHYTTYSTNVPEDFASASTMPLSIGDNQTLGRYFVGHIHLKLWKDYIGAPVLEIE